MQLSEETTSFIKQHAHDDVRALALQAKKYPLVDMPEAVTQISGRQIAAIKLPSWHAVDNLWYPRHLSMEQCSSESTALYKASLVKGDTLTDLTGGLGIDCSFLSRNFKQTDYVERQEVLCELAQHNFPVLGLNIRIHHQDGVEYLKEMEPVDCLFLDPARRDGHGGKTIAIADCEPDVSTLESLLVSKSKCVVVKLSPMLDLTLALKTLHTVHQVHVVSLNHECKELLLILQQEPLEGALQVHCEHILSSGIHQHDVFTLDEERNAFCPMAEEVGNYLYEPNASILKAGAYRSITQHYAVKKLHVNSHLYTSDEAIPNFPGRVFQVEGVSGFGKKELKAFMDRVDKANLTIRNFPSSVADLRKRLKLKEGGDTYLFATTLSNEQKVLVKCRKNS